MTAMQRKARIIDFDRIEDWEPWLDQIMASIGPNGMIDRLRAATPEYIEDARDAVTAEVGRDKLVDELSSALAPFEARVFHGTRVTPNDLISIRRNGLRALHLSERRDALTEIFSQHPDWHKVESGLDAQLRRFGPEWKRSGAGRREDDSVHVCLSRAGLLHGCNHYLTHGAEVDGHIAHALFGNESAHALLASARAAKIISFVVLFDEAARAANPWGCPRDSLPDLVRLIVSAWAYRKAYPNFAPASQRFTAALRFPAPVGPERLVIEDVEDAELAKR